MSISSLFKRKRICILLLLLQVDRDRSQNKDVKRIKMTKLLYILVELFGHFEHFLCLLSPWYDSIPMDQLENIYAIHPQLYIFVEKVLRWFQISKRRIYLASLVTMMRRVLQWKRRLWLSLFQLAKELSKGKGMQRFASWLLPPFSVFSSSFFVWEKLQ